MENQKIKIALFIRGFHNGGIEKVFELYYSHMDLSPYEIHVITHMKNDAIRQKVFTDMGCIVHTLSPVHGHKLTMNNFKEYKALFNQHQFDVVHNNMPDNLLPLYYAKKYQIPCRILHAHNDYTASYNLKQKLLSPLYKIGFSMNTSWSNCLIGVSRKAAASAFGQKAEQAILLPNAIELSAFRFNAQVRATYRSKLGVADYETLLGHIGRYENNQKNQEFVLAVFHNLVKKHYNVKLVMIGEGKRRKEFEQMAQELEIQERVCFTGAVPNVPDYLNAMDVFIFPSRKEGLGIVAVEAQTTGLYCLISDNVPREAVITDHAEFLPIEGKNAVEQWGGKLEHYIAGQKRTERSASATKVREAGYDISNQCKRLEEIYLKVK